MDKQLDRRSLLVGTGLAIGSVALTNTKAEASAISPEKIKVFSTVSEMVADTAITLGDYVKTLGYHSIGDGGAMEYVVVANGSGQDDGGEFIDLPAVGFLAQGLLPDGPINIKHYGAESGNVSSLLTELIDKRSLLLYGDYNLNEKVDFQPHRISLTGDVNVSNITNHGGGYLRFGAVGGQNREVTNINGINFEGEGKIIDAQAVFPININDCRLYKLGLGALRFYQIYYGKINDVQIFASQLDFENVNNYTIDGTDIHGDVDLEVFSPNDYACILDDCDRITFRNLTIESWKNRLIHVIKNKSLRFASVYFEANTADRLIQADGCSDLSFDGCFMELYPSPTESFIHIDNSNLQSPPANGAVFHPRNIITQVNISNSHLRLNNSMNNNFFLVNAEAGESVVTISNCVLRSGLMLFPYNVSADVKGLTLSTTHGGVDEVKFVESISNVDITNGQNNWVTNSVMSDPDMVSGPIISVLSGSANVSTDSTVTSQNGVSTKVSLAPGGTVKLQRLASEMGSVSEGETYLVFVRARCSHNIPMQLGVGGFYTDFSVVSSLQTKTHWTDYVMKTDSAVTYAQAATGNPKVIISLTNNTSESVEFYIDRIDYKKVRGDIYLP